MLVERYNWPLSEIESMHWSDFRDFVEGADMMYKREMKAAQNAAKRR